MATKAELLLSLQDRGYGTDTSNSQERALARAYTRLINMRRWDWLIARQQVSVAAGTNTIALSTLTNMRNLTAVRIDGFEDPDYLPIAEFYNWIDNGVANGVPQVWTRSGSQIILYPNPDRALTFQIDFVNTPATWTAIGVGQIPVPDPLADWMVWMAIADICFRERDSAGHDQALGEAGQIMSEYMAQHGLRQQQTSSEVVSTGWGENYTDTGYLP